jgi:hypothetical protein
LGGTTLNDECPRVPRLLLLLALELLDDAELLELELELLDDVTLLLELELLTLLGTTVIEKSGRDTVALPSLTEILILT